VSFLDGLDDEGAPLVPYKARSSEEKQLDRLRTMEDRILTKSLALVEDIAGARDIDDNHDDSIPVEWVKEVGLEEAGKRLRVAKDARRTKKEAPVYLEHTKAVALGILKAREARPVNIQSLKATFIIAAPPKAQNAYPIIDIEADDVSDE
jgi:hypothetical protein